MSAYEITTADHFWLETYTVQRSAMLSVLNDLYSNVVANLEVKVCRHAYLWDTELAVILLVVRACDLKRRVDRM